jgi:hypothetical protein
MGDAQRCQFDFMEGGAARALKASLSEGDASMTGQTKTRVCGAMVLKEES